MTASGVNGKQALGRAISKLRKRGKFRIVFIPKPWTIGLRKVDRDNGVFWVVTFRFRSKGASKNDI